MRKCSLAAAAAILCLGGSPVAWSQDESPAVVPYRPSVATPADLPAPGWPELEAGMAWTKGGDTARTLASTLTFKLAWSECWAVLVGTDAYDRQRAYDGSTTHGGGDTSLFLKYRLPAGEHLALGATFGPVLPTARPPIGNGSTAWAVNTIASFDYPGVHVDVNAAGVRLGSAEGEPSRWQGAWAVAASHPLDDRFGITGEVSGTGQRETSARSQGLLALNYNASRALVLDVAAATGLSRGSAHWVVMTGLTVQLGHWF